MSRRQRSNDIVASPDLRAFDYVAVIDDVELQDQLHLHSTGTVLDRLTMPSPSMAVTSHPQLRSSPTDRGTHRPHRSPLVVPAMASELPRQPFDTEAHEYRYPTAIAAKPAIADEIGTPLAKLSPEDLAFIEGVLAETLRRSVVLSRTVDFLPAKILESTKIRGALHP